MNRTIVYKNQTILYEFEREKRKSLSVKIRDDGTIIVKAPKWVTIREVEKFLISKCDWIIAKQEEVLDRKKLTQKEYRNGSIVKSLGNLYLLSIKQGGKNQISIKGDYMIVTATNLSEEAIREQIIKWNNRQLKKYIEGKIDLYLPYLEQYSRMHGRNMLPINRISIKNVKTRWGSCSSKGALNFNNKLAVAPPVLTDYVIVHEMCHLIYMNHSKDFWSAVEYIIPDYKVRRKALKDNGWEYCM